MVRFPSNPNFSFTETCQLPYQNYEINVVSVLNSVKLLFSNYFTNVDVHPLKVINVYPSKDFPMTVSEENTIYLSVSPLDIDGNPGNYWSQFIYQFSHEFCHYMSFGDVAKPMRWFEETLCELASHFFMIKSAEQWAVFPPYTIWRTFAPSILEYEISLRNQIVPINLVELSDPHSKLLFILENYEYHREMNRFIALHLLPLFIMSPILWDIVPYLTSLSDEKSFADNLMLLGDLSGVDISEFLPIFGIIKESIS